MTRSTRRWLVAAALLPALPLIAAAAVFLVNSRDRHPGYRVEIDVPAAEPAPLSAGFAALPITPTLVDRWTDADGNARLDEGDPWQDGDGNGRFDGHWLAGFHNRRPATGVHDDLWARAMVLGDGRTKLAIVVLDLIGLMHDQVVEIRQRIPSEAGLDYVIVCTTHTHEGPDTLGLWGPSVFRSGVDADYLAFVIERAAAAAARAARDARPAELRFAEVPEAASALVTDSRRPVVLDAGLRLLHAVDSDSGASLGVLASWGNHPETTGSDNLEISSDFPHFLRQGLEAGVRDGERVLAPGLGGVAVFAVGAIGGLMTTPPDFAIRDPASGELHTGASFEKARAQGLALARLGLDALAGRGAVRVREAAIALRARTLELPLDNPLFLYGAGIGALPRGFVRLGRLRTEIAAFRVGPASFVAVPGEIYPEIVNGGIESPEGADFAIAPQELPPLRERMPGRFRFVLGQANDAIGYVIPKSHWDDEAPWLYGADEETYGEVVSLGPETAPRLHAALGELLAELD